MLAIIIIFTQRTASKEPCRAIGKLGGPMLQSLEVSQVRPYFRFSRTLGKERGAGLGSNPDYIPLDLGQVT